MDQQNTTDVLDLFVTLAESLFDSAVASVIGPYLLIVFAAATGACWSLGRRESKGGWSALFYFIRVVATAVILTSVIAQLLTTYFKLADANLWIAPVALIIGVVGDDWLRVFRWFLDVIKRVANNKVNKELGE